MEEMFSVTLTLKEEPLHYEYDPSTELKEEDLDLDEKQNIKFLNVTPPLPEDLRDLMNQEDSQLDLHQFLEKTESEDSEDKEKLVNLIDLSPTSSVSNAEPETVQFVDPSDIRDSFATSDYVDATDPLCDLKQEPVHCTGGAQPSCMDDTTKNDSCLSEVCRAPKIRPCFVHLVRLDIPDDQPINGHQFFFARPLDSQSSNSRLSPAEDSHVGTFQSMPSGIDLDIHRHTEADHGNEVFQWITKPEYSDGNRYCENCLKTITHSAHNTLPVRGHISDTSKCISCQELLSIEGHPEPLSGVHLTKHPDYYIQSDIEFTHNAKSDTYMQLHKDECQRIPSHSDKPFKKKGNTKRLIRCCSEDRNCKCSHSKKAFTVNHDVRKLMRYEIRQRPYQCSQCDKAFKQTRHLKAHLRYHTGERPYQCSQCDKAFTYNYILKTHLRCHTGERPYQCSHCDKAFTQKCHLKAHMRRHTGERPYHCSHCDKHFNEKSALITHMRYHTGERPYQCSQCDKAFKQSSHLKTHMKCHTTERPYHCFQCEKDFKHKQGLITHMKYHTQ